MWANPESAQLSLFHYNVAESFVLMSITTVDTFKTVKKVSVICCKYTFVIKLGEHLERFWVPAKKSSASLSTLNQKSGLSFAREK